MARPAAYAYAAVAAAAMLCTLPGRTHGLGLITEPLLKDLALDRVPLAAINFWGTLIGAAFCFPVGWVIDRVGTRWVLAGHLLALGAVCLAMTAVTAGGSSGIELPVPDLLFTKAVESVRVPTDLFLLVLLTRGLGQSALSVISLAIVGKVAGPKPGPVIGFYSFLVAIFFMAAFGAIRALPSEVSGNWRAVWGAFGWILIVAAVPAVFVPSPKILEPTNSPGSEIEESVSSATLREAMATAAFWVFGVAVSFYGLIAAGTSLFNQSILEERGFSRDVFLTISTVAPLIGLAANLVTGFLSSWIGLGRLLAASLAIQTAALASFPFVTELYQVYLYAAAMGVAGGMMTVLFFTVWRVAYGPKHLGKIQAVAQLLTVLASAAGPLVLAVGKRETGSYKETLFTLAVVSAVMAVVAFVCPVPKREVADA
jgi:MFS family permease